MGQENVGSGLNTPKSRTRKISLGAEGNVLNMSIGHMTEDAESQASFSEFFGV